MEKTTRKPMLWNILDVAATPEIAPAFGNPAVQRWEIVTGRYATREETREQS